ncbi:Glutamate receptor-like 48 [Homarus americanus]|uniref:Glutamate receptor-like 48 n=1 Tax=Homarus americanus TaxID=6706 RepID=A0A8J5N7D8_HOMAM|nr:Glutamate receptor-like 48 [Homarus americanus]
MVPVEFREVFTFGSDSVGVAAEEVVGTWRPGHAFKLPYRGDVNAPRDFQGNPVRMAVIQSAPHVLLTKVPGRELKVTGYLADVMKVLEHQLNFTIRWVETVDGDYGVPLDNGTWTGLVGDLVMKRADVAISPLSQTLPRVEVMDFSPPVDHDSMRILVVREHTREDPEWNTYLGSFHWTVWVTTGVVWVVMSVGVVMVERSDTVFTSLYNYLFIFLGALTQQGRLVVISFWAGCVVLYAYYTAFLTSQLAVVNTRPLFTSLLDALTTAGYTVSTQKGTSYVSEMKTSQDKGLRLAYQHLSQDPSLLVDSVSQGVSLLHSSKPVPPLPSHHLPSLPATYALTTYTSQPFGTPLFVLFCFVVLCVGVLTYTFGPTPHSVHLMAFVCTPHSLHLMAYTLQPSPLACASSLHPNSLHLTAYTSQSYTSQPTPLPSLHVITCTTPHNLCLASAACTLTSVSQTYTSQPTILTTYTSGPSPHGLHLKPDYLMMCPYTSPTLTTCAHFTACASSTCSHLQLLPVHNLCIHSLHLTTSPWLAPHLTAYTSRPSPP